MDVILVYINFPTLEKARQIGAVLIEEQLAACVNIIPSIESIYSWKGEICNESEVMVIAKTTSSRFTQLEARVIELHPYDTPEIVGQDLDRGSDKYLNWVRDQMEGHH